MARQERPKKAKEKKIKRGVKRTDFNLYMCLLMLCFFGVVMVFSASEYSCSISEYYNFDSMALAKKQLIYAIAGLVAIFVVRLIPYGWYQYFAILAYVGAIVLILLLKTSLGVEVKGAVRWLKIGVQFQVAEVVKIFLIIALASVVKKMSVYKNKIQGLFVIWGLVAVPTALLYSISNDLSSSLIILGIGFGMTFVFYDKKWIHILLAGAAVVGALIFRYIFSLNMPTPEQLDSMPFRVGRIAAWISPERYADDQGYQTLQALYAIGSGGIFGKGLGNGMQKLTNIPESQNDMIFAIICEELGMVGACIVIYMFGYLIYQMIRIAISSKDIYGAALVTGIALHIGLQVIVNVAVCLNFFPNTGISLPFISYGGTSLLFLLFEMGIVFAVSRKALDNQ